MIGYWIHVKNSPSPIVQDILELSKQLHREGKTSWFTSKTKIAEITGNRNNKIWYSKRIEYSQGKLRLYTHLKVRPGFEQYLNLSKTQNKCMQIPH